LDVPRVGVQSASMSFLSTSKVVPRLTAAPMLDGAPAATTGAGRAERWDLDSVPVHDREERWEQLLSVSHIDMAVRMADDRPQRPFQASVRRLWIDDLALVDARCDPCAGTRGVARIKNADIDYVVLLIAHSGRESVWLDGESTDMRSGDAVIWDTAKPGRFKVWEPMVKRSLFIPRAAWEEAAGRRSGPVGVILRRDAPTTELLTSYLGVLAHTVDRLPAHAVAAAREATLNLVAAATLPEAGPFAQFPSGEVLRATIGQWVERNIARPDLTPATIAQAHSVSVRTVHRVFEQSGETLGALIRRRRLARARLELVEGINPITTIAARWGFSDPSHFTRAFRAQYGTSPTAFRADQVALRTVESA
jgi:AraC family transcriptional regulator, positive regulator of tynA and feaB